MRVGQDAAIIGPEGSAAREARLLGEAFRAQYEEGIAEALGAPVEDRRARLRREMVERLTVEAAEGHRRWWVYYWVRDKDWGGAGVYVALARMVGDPESVVFNVTLTHWADLRDARPWLDPVSLATYLRDAADPGITHEDYLPAATPQKWAPAAGHSARTGRPIGRRGR